MPADDLIAGVPGQSEQIVSVLRWQARVRAPQATLARLRALAPQLVTCAPANAQIQTISVTPATPPVGFRVTVDGQPGDWHAVKDELPLLLTNLVTVAALEGLAADYLLFHAGALAWQDQGLLLPAASGSGKTTLVGALLAAGWRVGGDEVGAVERRSGRLVAFPRSLNVNAGGRAVLAPLLPELATAVPWPLGAEQIWPLRPADDAWLTSAVPVRHIVFPQYTPGEPSTLRLLSRAEALARLLPLAHNARQLGGAGIDECIQLVRGADCYRLTIGDLTNAVTLLQRLVESRE
ncbi:MAG: hypothetical protein ACTHMJ_23885 [Thermomicrobiales bacterium]